MKNKKELRRIIREFIEKSLLSESMSMHISGFKYSDDLDHILDICNYIEKMIEKNLWDGYKQETREGWGEIITPDGGDAFDATGVINFYVGRLDLDDAKKTVEFIKYILGEKDIVVGDVKWEKVKDKVKPEDFEEWGIKDGGESFRVVRIHVTENNAGDSGNPPEVNLSNRNAGELFGKMLGYPQEDYAFEMDARDLVMKVDKSIKELPGRRDIPERSYDVQNRNIIDTVNGKDYYNRVLSRVRNFAQWAIDHGYTRIHVA